MRRPAGDNSNRGEKGLPASVGGADVPRGEAAFGNGGGAVMDDERHDTEAGGKAEEGEPSGPPPPARRPPGPTSCRPTLAPRIRGSME